MSLADEVMQAVPDRLDAAAARVREAGALGRSPVIQRLFDYLLQRSREGAPPKEIEVAEAVFGRRSGFDISQDSTVRVYVHRLRRKLEEFYAGPGREETVRLAIPKGEYRLAAFDAEDTLSEVETRRAGGPAVRWLAAALALIVVLNLALVGAWWWRRSHEAFAEARRSELWAPLLRDKRPITLVVGDYYIFGETDEHGNVSRLIREYDINSAEEFDSYLMDNPSLLGKYTDLGLHYLPVSIASALHDLTPLMAPDRSRRERIRVVKASELTPEMLKSNNIVYVGYLSGLGILREPVFAGSRFRVGETYDELIDRTNNRIYQSQEGGPEFDITKTRLDYGFVSTFEGPNGARILVIAGNRDVGVMETAKALSDPDALKVLTDKAPDGGAYEALYEVEAINRVNIRGRLVQVSPLAQDRIWSHAVNLSFPKN